MPHYALLRRTPHAALAGLIALVAMTLIAVSAHASESLDYSPSGSQVLDTPSHHYWNQYISDSEKVISFNGYQYMTFWNENNKLAMTRRRLSDNSVQAIQFNFTMNDPDDPHLNTVIGISPNNGRLHLSFGHHNDPHNYMVSAANFLTSPPATLSAASFSTVSRNETALTYPRYFSDNAGDLYFTYRNGSSAKGDRHLMWYHSALNQWWEIGVILKGKKFNNPGETDLDGNCVTFGLQESCERGPYESGINVDRNDRFHMTWAWREGVTAAPEHLPDHGMNYAYSDDYGITWRSNNGDQVADLDADDPIYQWEDTSVASIPAGYWSHNALLSLDSKNQPHIVTSRTVDYAQDVNDGNSQIKHYWRSFDGAWHEQWVTDTSQHKHGWRNNPGRPLFDGGDNMYMPMAEDRMGWVSNEADAWEIRDFGWRTGGYAAGTKDGTNAEISTLPIKQAITNQNVLTVRMKHTSSTPNSTGRFDYITDADRTWNASKRTEFALANDASWHTYTLNMGTLTSGWTGELKEMTFNPIWTSSAGASFTIDYIRIGNGTTNVKEWNFDEGWKLVAYEFNASDNYQTGQKYDLSTGADQIVYDEGFNYDWRRFASDRIISIPSVEQDPTTGAPQMAIREFTLGNEPIAKAWEFAISTDEWTNTNNITGWSCSSGKGKGTITAANAEIWTSGGSLGVPISNAGNRYLKLRLTNNTGATQGKIFWQRNGSATWEGPKTFTTTANSSNKDILIDMNGTAAWSGTLDTLNVYPATAATSGSFSIDWLRVTPSPVAASPVAASRTTSARSVNDAGQKRLNGL